VERARKNRGRRRSSVAAGLTISVAVAATLGMALYLVSTSLPYLVDAPAADPRFGAFNRCLISTLREPRAGFAVAPGGAKVAAYGASSVAVCEPGAPAADGGALPSGLRLSFSGVTGAAFDFGGDLWLSAAQGPRPELWVSRSAKNPPRKVGEVAPVALVGLSAGVAALDASGRLASFTVQGGPEHSAFFRKTSSALLAANLDGTLLAVVTGSTAHVLRASDLSPVQLEDSCQAQFLWWLASPTRALISCAEAGSTLLIDVATGSKQAASGVQGPRSWLIPLLGAYVQSCDQLPCSAPPPKP